MTKNKIIVIKVVLAVTNFRVNTLKYVKLLTELMTVGGQGWLLIFIFSRSSYFINIISGFLIN